MKDHSKWITIGAPPNQAELAFVKLRLKALDIPFFVQNEYSGALYPFAGSFAMPQIQVLQSDIEKVKSVLNEFKNHRNIENTNNPGNTTPNSRTEK